MQPCCCRPPPRHFAWVRCCHVARLHPTPHPPPPTPRRLALRCPRQRLAPVPPPYDVIVGSDLVYYSCTPETPHSTLLLWTLRRLSGPFTVVFLSLSLHHNPGEVAAFLGRAAEWFDVRHIRRSIPEQWRVPDVTVVRLRLRQQQAAGGGQGGPEGAAAAGPGHGAGC